MKVSTNRYQSFMTSQVKRPVLFPKELPCAAMFMLIALTVFSASGETASRTSAPVPFGVIGTYAPSDFYVTDVDIDSAGNIYAADVLKKTVTKYAADGTVLLRIADPALIWPRTIAIDHVSKIYVLDNVKGEIRVYSDTSGALLDIWPGFKCAGELDVDNEGYILVAMNGNKGCAEPRYEVIRLDTIGNEVFNFGSAGSGDGQFNHNYGITSGSDGSIVVADGSNQRFQKFDADGVFQFAVGSVGPLPGQFVAPRSSAIDSLGNIYINDRRNFRIQKFDEDGLFLGMWGSKGVGPGQFFESDGIEIASDDSLWVAGYHNHDIQQFDNNGVLLQRWQGHVSGPGEFFDIKGIGVSDGKLFAVDGNNQRIQVFDGASGGFLAEFGSRGQGDATVFNFPRSLATGPEGDIYVNDDDNIRRMKPDGTFVTRYPRLEGVRSGSLGLVVSDDGIIYQSDTGNNRINKIDASTGELLAQWGSTGGGPGQFKKPRGIAIGPGGNIYVVDGENKRIQVFDPDGAYLTEWLAKGGVPRGITIDRAHGVVYVGEWKRVSAYDLSGNRLFSWNGTESSAGGFQTNLFDIALSEDGEIVYIADRFSGHILRYIYPGAGVGVGKPAYNAGEDLGIFVWQDIDDGEWHVRFSGDGPRRRSYSIHIETDTGFVGERPFSLEAGEQLISSQGLLDVSGTVWGSQDGLDFSLSAPGKLIFTVTIDGQTQNLNIAVGASGLNPSSNQFELFDQIATEIPMKPWFGTAGTTPYGPPAYDAATEPGLFLWKDLDGTWHIRVTGGGGLKRYTGSIITDSWFVSADPVNLEPSDLVDVSDPARIEFDISVYKQWVDGIDFEVPEGATISLDLVRPSTGAADVIFVGSDKWPVEQLPLDLGGW